MSERTKLIDVFLADSPWQNWARATLAGDASARRYLRLSHGKQSVILMDAPPENGEDTTPFAQIASLLKTNQLSPPDILAHDPLMGLMVLSDLGGHDFAQWSKLEPADQPKLYQSATNVLLHIATIEPPTNLVRMTPNVGAAMINIIGTHYTKTPVSDLCVEMERALQQFAPEPTTLALRDFHAENLIWRGDQRGMGRIGLLDFQDAFVAPLGYDLASLLRDARRDVPQTIADDCIAYFSKKAPKTKRFSAALACLGVQRNLRILGVFARLASDQGKTRYLRFMPRVWNHILQDLRHPALTDLNQAVRDVVPTPQYVESST